jgi:hypothetical protein
MLGHASCPDRNQFKVGTDNHEDKRRVAASGNDDSKWRTDGTFSKFFITAILLSTY